MPLAVCSAVVPLYAIPATIQREREREEPHHTDTYIDTTNTSTAIYIYYLCIAYLVYSCDVSPLLQEQKTDDVTANTGCIVQCSKAKLQ